MLQLKLLCGEAGGLCSCGGHLLLWQVRSGHVHCVCIIAHAKLSPHIVSGLAHRLSTCFHEVNDPDHRNDLVSALTNCVAVQFLQHFLAEEAWLHARPHLLKRAHQQRRGTPH